MNDPHRAEKLALARRKLKEFESKRRTDGSPTPHADGRCSSLSNGSVQSMDRIEAEREPFQVVNANGSDNLHIDRQTNASSVSSINSSVVMTNGGQMETGQILPHPYTSAIETRLVQERDVAVQAYEQIKQQLSDLHGHYAHLHAAYSHLSSNRAHSELESQIIQLQSAVSVLVEEKTTLQAELRVAREQCEQIATSHIKVQADAVQFQTEQELRNLRHKLEQALALTGAQATELEQQRRISAETQARTISVQNEKSEAQLRVKALIRDRDALNEELAAVRKDLQMKNLHLKQLTKHQSQTPDETAAASDQIHTMTERLETITAELLATRTERDVVIKDSETSRRQFERYTAELSERNGSLRQEIEAAETQRSFFESRAQELEMQLTHLQQSSGPSEAQNAPPADSSQAEEYLKKIRHLEEKLSETTSKLLAEKKDAGEQIERYSSVVAMKNEEVLNMSIKLRQLEERIQETRASESELLLLSEQLQSEKATVSRAVAQNKELKEQLLETEDRIFVLTNEKMQMEMDKEAAEHQVRVLSEQLGGSHNLSSSHQDESADHLEANEAEALAMRTEKEHELQQKLAQALHELADTRQELRQSHSRNEQMNQIMMNNAEDENQNSIHVELGHAMTRVNQLAAENEQLRESLAELHRRESELTEQLAFLPKIETVLEAKESPARERKESEVLEDVVDETHPVLCSPQNFTGPKLEQWARIELEKKFTESMRRNAELADNLDKIEHINEQLQMENETIGDHVILYHQQRKIIQDRLRLKDQQLLAMEAEKQRVVERCRELQQAMREVLAARDLPNTSPLNRSVYRSYSHSTIDEINGDEEQLVSEEDANSQVDCSTSQKDDGEVVYREEGRTSPQLEGTEAKVQRIFNILDEISTTPVKSADDMHCSHCIGELKKL